MERYVCIHGHFYQPPRENPWLEAVEIQDSAYPYHDWNERIAAECYAQNASSRILDDAGRIVDIRNNYASMSFNVGPTLLAWMATEEPELHARIVAADRESADRFSGHGSAIAQAYNHLIMPLASERDRRTQIRWGMADFEARFGRRPEGMWLPETAVDTRTLELLAEEGIAFTILEPGQARRVREPGGPWRDLDEEPLDTTVAYRAVLPSGRDLGVFFYDGAVSRAVAFEGLLRDGAALAARLTSAFDRGREAPQLVHIATDGESYGHHHRHGDMALAFALQQLEADPDVRLTNYGEFLSLHPPRLEVEVADATSWSCAHGVERWRDDCGCADGGHPGWDQSWRAPLRHALDRLREQLDPLFEDAAEPLLRDPWAARDDYVRVLLDRSPQSRDAFLAEHATRPLTSDGRTTIWRLLELQRHAMFMYTSCGWFFDDLGRIETVQILRYAYRAIELARDVSGVDLEPDLVDDLAKAQSNDPELGDGRAVWEEHVRPAMIGLRAVAANHALASVFAAGRGTHRIHGYDVVHDGEVGAESGAASLRLGRVRIASVMTERSGSFEYGVVHLGDHNLVGGVRDPRSDAEWSETIASVAGAFEGADLPETIRRIDAAFGEDRYTIASLFRDEQHRILRIILDGSIADAVGRFRSVHRERAPLMRYLTQLGANLPRAFRAAAEVVVNGDLRRAFEDPAVDPQRVRGLLADAAAWNLELDEPGLAHALDSTIDRLTQRVARELSTPRLFDEFTDDVAAVLDQARTVVELSQELPFEVDVWRAQNLLHATLRDVEPELRPRARAGNVSARRWLEALEQLADALHVAV